MSGNFIFDWNVREFCCLSGNFLAFKCHLHSCSFTVIINVFLSLALLISLFLVILECWTAMGKQDHYDLRG